MHQVKRPPPPTADLRRPCARYHVSIPSRTRRFQRHRHSTMHLQRFGHASIRSAWLSTDGAQLTLPATSSGQDGALSEFVARCSSRVNRRVPSSSAEAGIVHTALRHTGCITACITLRASHWVHHCVHHTACVTLGASLRASHCVRHTGCIAQHASHCVRHTGCITLRASHCVRHTGCITACITLRASHCMRHTGCITACNTLHASHWVHHCVHHTACITLRASHWVHHCVHHTACVTLGASHSMRHTACIKLVCQTAGVTLRTPHCVRHMRASNWVDQRACITLHSSTSQSVPGRLKPLCVVACANWRCNVWRTHCREAPTTQSQLVCAVLDGICVGRVQCLPGLKCLCGPRVPQAQKVKAEIMFFPSWQMRSTCLPCWPSPVLRHAQPRKSARKRRDPRKRREGSHG